MKPFHSLLALALTLWVSMVAGTAVADVGAGACVAGVGFDAVLTTSEADGYAAVNVGSPVADPTGELGFGQGSQTGVYDSQAAFQAQCCAESGLPADCFAPVQ